MTRNVTTSFRRSAEASFSDEVDLCFLTLSHPSLSDDIRVVWDTHDFYYGTLTFIGFPFDVSILSDDENPPTAQLTIQNVDPRIGDTIRLLNSPPRLKIELGISSDFSYALLLHCDGDSGSALFPDSGGNNMTVTAMGSAHVRTSQKIFGSGSAAFNSPGDYLAVAANSSLVLSTNDFTIDFWFRSPDIGDGWTTNTVVYDTGSAELEIWFPPDGWHYLTDESNNRILDESGDPILDGPFHTISLWANDVNQNKLNGTTPIQPNTDYHIELTRSSGILRMFLNGVQEGGEYRDVVGGVGDVIVDYVDNSPTIGADFAGAEPFFGAVDEVRVINGAAAHTEDFNLPLAPYVPSYATSPDIIYSADKLFLINVTVDVFNVTGQIVGWDYLQRVWPGPRAMQAVFPGLFR